MTLKITENQYGWLSYRQLGVLWIFCFVFRWLNAYWQNSDRTHGLPTSSYF